MWGSWWSGNKTDAAPAVASSAPVAQGEPSIAAPTKGGGCPVPHVNTSASSAATDPSSSKAQAGGCPVKHDSPSPSINIPNPAARPGSDAAEGCPVHESDRKAFLQNANAAGYNALANDLVFGQEKQPGQKVALSTERVESSIPNDDYRPQHQPEGTEVWVYPSEQQYYNAMKRKGYNPEERDVPVILAIHNTVNEQGWSMLKQWEAMQGCEAPKLRRFMGRPKDISPKAFFKSLFGYALPFDRHDWIVDSNGREQRYVIDFYKGTVSKAAAEAAVRSGSAPPAIAMHLDVRPAVDSPYAALVRTKVFFMRLMGINPFKIAEQSVISSRPVEANKVHKPAPPSKPASP